MSGAAQARAEQGAAPRLTRQIQADICAGLRTGTPINWCCEYVGISRETYRNWRMTAQAAASVPRDNRSQLQRRCVEFDAAVRQAIADAGMRVTMQIASAAGLTTQRPKRRRTVLKISGDAETPIFVDENGKVTGGRLVEAHVYEEELAPDWRAAARLGATRFPTELGDLAAHDDETAGADAPRLVTTEELWGALELARDRSGIVVKPQAAAIDAESYDSDTLPALPAANANGVTSAPPGDALTLTDEDYKPPSDEEHESDGNGENPS